MKNRRGRPMIPLSNISNRKADGLTGSPAPTDSGEGNAQLACGGGVKKRLDKKARGGKTVAKRESSLNAKHKQEHKRSGSEHKTKK